MKKLIIAVLCLSLASCGTFDIRVQILPHVTETATPTSMATSPTAKPSLTPALLEPTATAFVTPIPTVTPADEPITITAIQMNDDRRGWGVESSGRIIKTSDGGGVWQDVTPFQGKFASHSLFIFNNQTAWAVPAQLDTNNVVWRTQDGGSTWEASQPITFSSTGAEKYSPVSLQFPDARHGWLLVLAEDGGQNKHVLLYKSEDGGSNWTPISSINESVAQSYLPATVTTMAFFDGQNGWLGGWWGKDDPTQWLMLKTVDGGTKWGTDALRLPAQGSIQCNGHPITEMAPGSMAVDLTCTMLKDPKYLYHHLYYLSTSVEPAWRSWTLPGDLLSVSFLNASQGWMLITSDNPKLNQILSTRDGGKTWDKVNDVAWKQAHFDFVNDKTGWAIAGNGFGTALVRTENGGKLWIQVHPVLEP